MPRKLRVRTSPTTSLFAGIVGLIVLAVGITIVVPQSGAFGVFWVLAALLGVATSFYNAFSRNGIASEIIEVPDDAPCDSHDVETRLRRLDALHARGVISPAEYAEQRKQILRRL